MLGMPSLVVGSAYHNNANAKVERANGAISPYANVAKDCPIISRSSLSLRPLHLASVFLWTTASLRLSDHLLLVDFAIHNATHRRSATNRRLSLSSAAAHPRLPISPSHQDRTAGESRTARSECNRLRRRRCSLRCGRGGRRSSARAGSTRCSRGATGCCSGPRSCSNIADFGKLRPRRDGPFTPAAGGCAASRATWYGGGGTRHE